MEPKMKGVALLNYIAETATEACDEIGSLNDSRLQAAEKISKARKLVDDALMDICVKDITNPNIGSLYLAVEIMGEAMVALTEVEA